jgi:hypothetical protein
MRKRLPITRLTIGGDVDVPGEEASTVLGCAGAFGFLKDFYKNMKRINNENT